MGHRIKQNHHPLIHSRRTSLSMLLEPPRLQLDVHDFYCCYLKLIHTGVSGGCGAEVYESSTSSDASHTIITNPSNRNGMSFGDVSSSSSPCCSPWSAFTCGLESSDLLQTKTNTMNNNHDFDFSLNFDDSELFDRLNNDCIVTEISSHVPNCSCDFSNTQPPPHEFNSYNSSTLVGNILHATTAQNTILNSSPTQHQETVILSPSTAAPFSLNPVIEHHHHPQYTCSTTITNPQLLTKQPPCNSDCKKHAKIKKTKKTKQQAHQHNFVNHSQYIGSHSKRRSLFTRKGSNKENNPMQSSMQMNFPVLTFHTFVME